jgi:quercetin dioxygenase-like cupin family protein
LQNRKLLLLSTDDGWDGWVMRVMILEKGGYTPKHSHWWPHINYILEGEGTLYLDGKENPIEKDSTFYIPGNELHQFKNSGENNLKFICIVPKDTDKSYLTQ